MRPVDAVPVERSGAGGPSSLGPSGVVIDASGGAGPMRGVGGAIPDGGATVGASALSAISRTVALKSTGGVACSGVVCIARMGGGAGGI